MLKIQHEKLSKFKSSQALKSLIELLDNYNVLKNKIQKSNLKKKKNKMYIST